MPSSEPPSTTRPPAGVSSSGPTDAPGESPPPPPPPSTTSQAPSTVEAFLQNDPARTGFDPQTQWWVNYFRVLTGGMTAEGRHHYRESRYRANEARDCARCEKHRDYLLRYSPIVRFLAEKVADLNGALDASNILCRRCPAPVRADGTAVVARRAAGFDPAYGILLCANEMRDRKHLEDSLAHEMVHAWDHLRWKAEFAGEKGLRHAACTEVRRPFAALLSPPLPPLSVFPAGERRQDGAADRGAKLHRYGRPC